MRARRHGEGVRLDLDHFEAELLRNLPAGLRALLTDPDPDDPAVARLFPACVSGDERADRELRRLLFDDLLKERLDTLDEVVAILERGEERRGRVRVDLRDEEPTLLLGVLNDVRLTLGARIGIEHLDRDRIAPDDEAAPTIAVIDHLAWLQEQLLGAIDPPSTVG